MKKFTIPSRIEVINNLQKYDTPFLSEVKCVVHDSILWITDIHVYIYIIMNLYTYMITFLICFNSGIFNTLSFLKFPLTFN